MTIHLEPKQVPANLKGRYTGKKFSAEVAETVKIPANASIWDHGSRTTYHGIDLVTGETFAVGFAHLDPWHKDRKAVEVTLAPGKAVVEHCIAAGTDMGLHFYVHPANAATLLPAKVELTEMEKLVLTATRSFKASYNGRDRYTMAAEEHNWSHRKNPAPFPTREQWEATKAALVVGGYLNKAGAITVKGRNAVPFK